LTRGPLYLTWDQWAYATDRVYRLHREPLAFRLSVELADPPRRTVVASLADEMARLRAAQHAVVADDGGAVVGLAAATEAWSRRVRVEHLYVAPSARGRGVGRALMDAVVAFARARGSWCVWLETQAANYRPSGSTCAAASASAVWTSASTTPRRRPTWPSSSRSTSSPTGDGRAGDGPVDARSAGR
jgi:GNAT superfamily N-acetyltransferase